MDSSLALNLAFPCGLSCFHVYKELWNPRLNENLDTIHEENNPHDWYAVAAIRETFSRLTPVSRKEMYPQGMGEAGVKEIANSDKPLPPVDPFEEIDLS